jgi:predicted enzyme related to lactoylglutathione lyase
VFRSYRRKNPTTGAEHIRTLGFAFLATSGHRLETSTLMSEQNEMDKTPGKISWKELMTPDAEASARFYLSLFGWVREEVDLGGSAYTFFKVGEEPVAGMAVLSAKSEGTPEGWTNYVTVDNLEDSMAKARELGGKVCKDITALQIGRFAIIQDPHGAAVGLWQFA